jgi:hypothetical protein
MTVSSAPAEEKNNQTPRVRFPRANAFRVLSLPADAELKRIHRQHPRLLVENEMGRRDGTEQYGLPPLRDLSTEEIHEAVHFLQRPEHRLLEELFWVHEMDSQIDGERHNVLSTLRDTAASNTNHGAVARHNLAVMHSILGRECAEDRRLDHWKEALEIWKKLSDDDLFWTFMKDRALRINCQRSDVGMMKAAVRRQLGSMFSEEMVRVVKFSELITIPVLARIAMEHRSWLELGAALKLVAQQETKNGFGSLGAILDRLSGITQKDKKTNVRSTLVELERELRRVADEYGEVVHSLGELADASGWDDAVSSCYQRLSSAFLDLLDDPDHAVRLLTQAREHACDPQLLQSIERDRRNLEWTILCHEADALARRCNFAGAERKLEEALAICNEEQKTEIKVSRDLYRRARESMERERQQVHRATLCREAGALAQRGDFAGAERKLEEALPISTEEQRLEINAMQSRCRWARVLHGVDTTKKNPVLYTLNGVGATFYGKRDYDPGTRSYETNHWLIFLFVPIFPLGTYRVTDADFRSYYIHGKAPLPDSLKKVRSAIVAFAIVLALAVVIGRGTPARSVGTLPTNVIASAQRAGTTEMGEKSILAPHSEKDDIERERTALIALVQSLEDRKRKLQAEGAEMDKRKGYLAAVASSYAGERVPDGGQSRYDAVFADYTGRVQKYNKKLAALKADFAAYNERVNSLNARIHIFNGFR